MNETSSSTSGQLDLVSAYYEFGGFMGCESETKSHQPKTIHWKLSYYTN
jgi:hypothetical protein